MERGEIELVADDWSEPIYADFSAGESQRIANPAIADLSFLSLPLTSAVPGAGQVLLLPEKTGILAAQPTRLGALIRIGLVLSIAIHGGLLASALVKLDHVEPLEAGDVASLAVDIVPTSSFSSNSVVNVQSDAVETMVSAGAETLEPVEPESLTPVENAPPMPVETIEPAEPMEMAETPAPEAQPEAPSRPVPVEAEAIIPSSAEEVLSVASSEPAPELEAVAPAALETVTEAASTQTPPEPVENLVAEIIEPVPEGPVVPVPRTRTVAQRTEPTYPERPRRQQHEPQRRAQIREQAPARQVSRRGNNGNAQADNIAGQQAAARGGGGGGSGSAEKYPGQVLSKLRRALRYPSAARGARGEVSVQFTVSAGGGVSGAHIVASSGNAVLDDAALKTVNRAAPFPPIPAEAGRASWTFTMPLGFVRR